MKKLLLLLPCGFLFAVSGWAQSNPSPSSITNFTSTGDQRIIIWTPFPAVKSYSILSSTNVDGPFTTNGGTITGFKFTETNSAPVNFYQFQVTTLTSNELLTANILNRLAYGPTPDELERILTGTNAIGPDAWIAEQLAPETISETVSSSHPNVNIISAKLAGATDMMVNNTSYAKMDDFRALHLLRAVGAKRQLLEVLLQFFENHFVTQYSKSFDYLDQFYDDDNRNRIAAQFEYLENDKWRTALLNPTGTFYDLLKISAESPAMIIYLDTVTSKGNGTAIANENYAREVMELFTMGVDNGYTQTDITAVSRSWTGWTLQIVPPTNALNPFAVRTTNLVGTGTNVSTISNLAGAWAFNFVSASHDTTKPKVLFTNAFIPARFGAPYTTTLYSTNTAPGKYQLTIPTTRGGGTNGIQDGYDVINYLANLPFTQEYISIKFCRLFVHDDFPNPSNDTNNPAYNFYNYAAGNLSPEAELVHQCMLAWENSNPKGQIRAVLSTIFNSDLFRSHGGSMQKVKTPLEYTVSAVRALRSSTNGIYFSNTDGYNLLSPINRMGSMSLFDRAAPDGYPEDAAYWISAGTLSDRIRFVQALCMITNQPNFSVTNKIDAGYLTTNSPVQLIAAKLPVASQTNAAAVVDYFLSIIFPGEGAGNLDLYRTAAINFLNDGTADSLANSTQFGGLAVSSIPTAGYDIRLRGMVALLLSYQRFHEQ